MKKAIFTAILSAMLLTSCAAKADGAVTVAESGSFVMRNSETVTEAQTETAAARLEYEIDPEKPVIALTFDDGPNTDTTPLVLDMLEKYGVPGSFFLIGNNINAQTEKVVKRAYDMGCEIDNHSKTHPYMNKMTAEEITAEVDFVSDKVKEITGETTRFFRPPYIAVNETMYENIDMPFICGVGCNDWDKNVTVEQRIEKTLAQVKDGTIILLHDASGNTPTVEALDTIIPSLLDEGYQFATVSELFEAKGVEISGSDTNLYTFVG